MRWVGILAAFLFLQVLLIGFFLYQSGRLPKHELSLLWTAIKTGKSAEETTAAEAPAPPEGPSYEELVKERTRQTAEIEKKRKEADGLLKLAEARFAEVDAARKTLDKVQTTLESKIETKEEQLAKAGQKKVIELLEAMAAGTAKDFLLKIRDENEALTYVRQLDPAVAKKIFKEFRQPDEIRRLGDWLEKIGQGEPEVSKIGAQKAQLPAVK